MTVPRSFPFGQFVGRIARVITLTVLFLAISHRVRAQEKPEEKTLLWEISGNGLEKPSYLYGTMHVQDKRVFDFADSVLVDFKRCSILAEETRLDSATSWILDQLMQADSNLPFDRAFASDRYEHLDSMMAENDSLPSGRSSRLKPWMTYMLRGESDQSPKDEATFLDAHLAHIARLEGMRMVGLETVEEQMNNLDRLPPYDMRRFFARGKRSGPDSGYERLIRLYVTGDLGGLWRLTTSSSSDSAIEVMLVRRNALMVDRLLPLLHQAPTFVAVGAAHLAGPKGLIMLLREQGFTVRPVISKRTGLAARYVPPTRTLDWISRTDSVFDYTAQYPVVPAIVLQRNENGIPLQLVLAPDIETGLIYLTMTFKIPLAGSVDPRSLLAKMFPNGSEHGKARGRDKEITVNGLSGIETEVKYGAHGHMRLRVFQSGTHIQISAVMTETAWHGSADVDRFFAGGRMLWSDHVDDMASWPTIADSLGAYSVAMPADAHKWSLRVPWGNNDSTTVFMLATAGENNYAMMYNDPAVINVFGNDSLYLAGRMAALERQMNGHVVRKVFTTFAGHPACEMTIDKEPRRVVVRAVLRGVRAYVALASIDSGRTDLSDRFLSSFTFLPLRESALTPVATDTLPFVISLPGAPLPLPDDSLFFNGYIGKRSRLYNRDSNSGALFMIAYGQLPPKYRVDDTADLFSVFGVVDSSEISDIVAHRIFHAGDDVVGEVISKREQQDAAHRVRCILHGNQIMTLQMFAPVSELTSQRTERVFESFHATGPLVPTEIFGSRLPEILADLDSGDSDRVHLAESDLQMAKMGTRDRPYIYSALLRPRADDTADFSLRQHLLWGLVKAYRNRPDSLTVPFLTRLYAEVPGLDGIRSSILTSLANLNTPAAVDSLALLLHRYPVPVDNNLGIGLLYRTLYDSLHPLLPKLLDLLDTPSKRVLVIEIASYMIGNERTQATVDNAMPALLKAALAMADTVTSGSAAESEGWLARKREWALVNFAHNFPQEHGFDPYLRAALGSASSSVAFSAALSLIERGREVPAVMLMRLCQDPAQRLMLYTRLKELKQLRYFPNSYGNQRALAEGFLVSFLSDEDDDEPRNTPVEFLADRLLAVKGKRGRYFLFLFKNEDSSYAAVVGPFAENAKNIDPADAEVWTSSNAYDEAEEKTYFDRAIADQNDQAQDGQTQDDDDER